MTDDWSGNDDRLGWKRRTIGSRSWLIRGADTAELARISESLKLGLDKFSGRHVCCECKKLVRLVASEVGERFTPTRF